MSERPRAFTMSPVSRRTLLTSAAWSAPVIAIAVAAPAAAASALIEAASVTPGVAELSAKASKLSAHNSGGKYRGVYANVTIGKAFSHNPAAVVSSMTMLLVFPAALQLSVQSGAYTVTGTGWSATSARVTPTGEFEYIFTFVSTAGLGPGYANTQPNVSIASTYTGNDPASAFTPRTAAGIINSPQAVSSVSFAIEP